MNIGLRDVYKAYNKENPEGVSSIEFREIWIEFIDRIVDEIILNNQHFRMPGTLGFLMIVKRKLNIQIDDNGKLITKNLTPDWKKTKELWARIYPNKTKEELKKIKRKKIVYLTNKHTDGFRMSWMWDKRALKNNTAYSFKISRSNGRALNNAIKNPYIKVNYYEY